jgi:hypothetical protein
MGLIKGMRLAEFGLMVFQFGLLLGRQHGELPLLLWVFGIRVVSARHGSIIGGQIIVVAKFRKHILLSA